MILTFLRTIECDHAFIIGAVIIAIPVFQIVAVLLDAASLIDQIEASICHIIAAVSFLAICTVRLDRKSVV